MALTLSACATRGPVVASGPLPNAAEPTAEELRRDLYAFADDSMRGRESGTIDEHRAAAFLADRLKALGLEPAGDSGFFQRRDVAAGHDRPFVRQPDAPGTHLLPKRPLPRREARRSEYFFTPGLHADYHKVTDSPEKIGYPKMARVATLIWQIGMAVGNRMTRPK